MHYSDNTGECEVASGEGGGVMHVALDTPWQLGGTCGQAVCRMENNKPVVIYFE